MPPLQLHIDLRERVLIHVPQLHQPVVNPHQEKPHYGDNPHQHDHYHDS